MMELSSSRSSFNCRGRSTGAMCTDNAVHEQHGHGGCCCGVSWSYPGDGQRQVEVLAALQPKAPGGGARQGDAVAAAHDADPTNHRRRISC